METISISKFKATCLALLERVRKTGQPILVTRRGAPVAQIVPPPRAEPPAQSTFGCLADTIDEIGDITQPLSESDWEVLR